VAFSSTEVEYITWSSVLCFQCFVIFTVQLPWLTIQFYMYALSIWKGLLLSFWRKKGLNCQLIVLQFTHSVMTVTSTLTCYVRISIQEIEYNRITEFITRIPFSSEIFSLFSLSLLWTLRLNIVCHFIIYYMQYVKYIIPTYSLQFLLCIFILNHFFWYMNFVN
jgi:hypothetical protein